MPPRKRTLNKKEITRIEAAIQTMKTEYGIFDVEVIKKVLDTLIKEYGGGEAAWYFIELYTYRELFEGIIRYRDEEEGDLPVNLGGGGDSFEGNSLRIETVEVQALEKAAESSTALICSEAVDNSLVEYKGWKDIGLDKTSKIKKFFCSNDDINTGSRSSAVPMIAAAPSRKHCWPCYGWIENGEEEDIDDFMELNPAKPTVRPRSRWDLRPEDP